MAKRSNPFIEDYIQQSKVHVGVKQFNNNEGRLQKVYEKTLNLLFRGAKSKGVPSPVTAEVPFDSTQNKFKQLFIGKNGALERDGVVEHNGIGKYMYNIQSFPFMKLVNNCPVACSCGEGASDCTCAYCEARLCLRCARACSTCEQSYCARCCFGASDGADICVSCYD